MKLEKIELQEKSPLYKEEGRQPHTHFKACDMAGCPCEATHKAPKDRSLNAYYNFCLEHVSAYNAAWDYFDGLSGEETEFVFRESLYGERPTRKMHITDDFIMNLRRKAFEFMEFGSFADKTANESNKKQGFELPENHPAAQALKLFELPLSATAEQVRNQYRKLVKLWHPDLHGGSAEAEEKLKQINMAYTLLKVRFEAP